MKRNSKSRPLQLESLESRYVLAGCSPVLSPSTNETMPADVNADGNIGLLDALIVVNELNDRAHSDPVTGELSCASLATHFIDPNGDAHVSPLDALMVVNVISARSQLKLDLGVSADEVFRVPWGESTFTPFEQVTIHEGGSKTLVSATVTLDDVYGGPFRLMPVNTKDTSISASFDSDTNTLHLTGEDSIANYVEVLSGLTFNYEPVIVSRLGSSLTLNVTVADGFSTSTATMNVLAESPGTS